MKYVFAIVVLASTAALTAGCFLWNQPVTKIEKDGPLALRCSATTWCDRRTEECHAPTTDRPDGYCVFVGDNGRAFGSKPIDGGAARE